MRTSTTIKNLAGVDDLDVLLRRIGTARIVMLGEASHGTHDYYRWREQLTRRLIGELGFQFVAVEGDWPDCAVVHEAVTTGEPEPVTALTMFDRWPTWMWANREVAEFCQWLQAINAARPARMRVGFHGLDVYSLTESLDVLAQHARAHGDDLDALWAAMRCFEPHRQDPQGYAWSTRLLGESCEPEATKLLDQAREVTRAASGFADFDLRQNAEVVAGAERYYRIMMRGDRQSWNVRDVHMADTLDRLLEHYGPQSKGVVWAHNTHIGDARATDMVDDGLTNIGHITRQRHGERNVVLVGFGSYQGTVMAAPRWAAARNVMTAPPARPGSLEARLHSAVPAEAITVFGTVDPPAWQTQTLGHRAIGVVYDPDSEHHGNYVPTVLGDRYDAFIWCDATTAIEPLHAQPAPGELETYPSGV